MLAKFESPTTTEKPISRQDSIITEPGDNDFDQLPPEIKLWIFTFLGMADLTNVAKVSVHWNSLSNLNCLWQKFVPNPSPKSTLRYKDEVAQTALLAYGFFKQRPVHSAVTAEVVSKMRLFM